MEKKTAMSETRKKEPGFEKSIARLEEIVRALVSGLSEAVNGFAHINSSPIM